MTLCRSSTLGGSQCELEQGHDPEVPEPQRLHQRGSFSWTEEGQKRLAKEWC